MRACSVIAAFSDYCNPDQIGGSRSDFFQANARRAQGLHILHLEVPFYERQRRFIEGQTIGAKSGAGRRAVPAVQDEGRSEDHQDRQMDQEVLYRRIASVGECDPRRNVACRAARGGSARGNRIQSRGASTSELKAGPDLPLAGRRPQQHRFYGTGTTGHPIHPFGEPLAGPQTALEDDSRSPFRNRSLLKTLSLLAPDFAALDSIWRHPLPFVLWPVGHQGLIDHWIDESVRQGAVEIRIYAADRPAEIRRHLSAGGFWSQRAQVTAIRTEVDAPSEAIPMDRLPQQDRQEIRIPDSQTLLSDCLEMQRFWLTHRDPRSVSVDAEVMPDGWLGPHVRVHPRASLHPPFWIGAGTEIGAGCRVGPYAVVGEGSVLDHDVEIENAVALPGTYLGPNTRLNKAIAQGGILVDIRRACRIDINEDFILGTVARHQRQTSALGKLAALGLWVLLAPFATLWPGQMWTSKRIINHQGLNLMLEGGSRGPLLLRRWPWLRQVALGNFCWFGILPRGDDEWAYLSAETAERLRSSPPGIFSWADLQGCHNPSSPDEWVHAAYQVLQPDETVKHLLQRQIVHLALLRPEV